MDFVAYSEVRVFVFALCLCTLEVVRLMVGHVVLKSLYPLSKCPAEFLLNVGCFCFCYLFVVGRVAQVYL